MNLINESLSYSDIVFLVIVAFYCTNTTALHISRRGFTIRLKRLKPRAPDFGGPQNFVSKDNFHHFCRH